MKFNILKVNEDIINKRKEFIIQLDNYSSSRDFLNYILKRIIELKKLNSINIDSISKLSVEDIHKDICSLDIKIKELKEKFNKYKFDSFILLEKLYAKQWYECNNEERIELIYDRIKFINCLTNGNFKQVRHINCWRKLHSLKAKIKKEREKNNDNI